MRRLAPNTRTPFRRTFLALTPSGLFSWPRQTFPPCNSVGTNREPDEGGPRGASHTPAIVVVPVHVSALLTLNSPYSFKRYIYCFALVASKFSTIKSNGVTQNRQVGSFFYEDSRNRFRWLLVSRPSNLQKLPNRSGVVSGVRDDCHSNI